nr:integrase, catalytic region, zinc finger, CCHC-type, peptidase aspartic, catalytic [Tanacetum cinerariifolium]
MSRDVLTVGSTMRIPLLYRGEYLQWVERFMNYLEEQTDGEAMINSIKNDDQPLPRVTQVSIAGTSSTKQPLLKDKSMWSDQEKRIQKIDHLSRSLLIQGLSNDIYSLIDSNKTTKDLWYALARHMLRSEYGEQDRKCAVLSVVIQKIINKNLIDINIDALYNILKQNQGDVNDAMGSKKKNVVVTSDPLALITEKTNVSRSKEKVVVSSDFKGSEADDFSKLKKITALLAKAFNRRKFYSKPTNNNLRTSSTSQSTNKKQEFVKTDNKKVEKKDDDKKRDMSRVKCYNCKKEGHFAKHCKKVKQTSSLKPYVPNVILEKIIIDLKDEVVNLLEKEKANLETIESLKSKDLDTFSSVRRPKHSGVIWKKKGSSNTSNVDLSAVSFSNLNKIVKRYSRKDLLVCNNSHLGETSSAYVCNDAMNVFCNPRMYDLLDDNNFFIFDDESVKISPVSKMPFRKKPHDSMNIVQICLWIIDSGCLKHITGNRALLTNFMEKFFGTVRFGNNDFAVIACYGDVVIGSMRIKKVYYVEGLGHNLFSVGQFCDEGLEVAF